MLHSLALVEIENGAAKHFLEAFFQVALVHGYLSAQFFDGDGLTNMLDEHFPGLYYLIAVGFISQELAIDRIDLFITDHAVHAVQ